MSSIRTTITVGRHLFERRDWITLNGVRLRVWRATSDTITTCIPGSWRFYWLYLEDWCVRLWRRAIEEV